MSILGQLADTAGRHLGASGGVLGLVVALVAWRLVRRILWLTVMGAVGLGLAWLWLHTGHSLGPIPSNIPCETCARS